MRITSLELIGFKRMSLNNVAAFTITPNQPIQMILGTNGCGKSSLIAELTPLPADPSAYLAEGSKTIKITHRGNNYTLTSVFSPKAKHSFLENEKEELNEGGTAAAQRELVRKIFKITPQIHELIIGQERFHQMGPGRRREWFTALSDISYDYAVEVFGRLKERSRDLSGSLKLARKRLVTESAKIINDAEEEKLRADVEVTHRELNLLIEQSAPLERPIVEIDRDRRHGFDELARLSRKLLNMRFAAPYGSYVYGLDPSRFAQRDDWGQVVQPSFESLEQIDSFLDLIRHEITGNEVLLNKAVEDHGKIEETIAVLMRTGEAGLQSLKDRMSGLREQRLEVLAKRKLGIEGLDPLNASQALTAVFENLTHIFSMLPENTDRRFSQGKLNEHNAKLLQLKDTRTVQSRKLIDLNALKVHMEVHKKSGSLSCPACGHSWILNYSEARYASTLQDIADQEEVISATDKQIEAVSVEITAISEYSALYIDYTRCVRGWSTLNPFWEYLAEKQYVTNSPRMALATLETFRADMEFELQAKKLSDEIREVEDLMRAAEKVGDATLSESQEKLATSTLLVERLTGELTRLRTQLNEYSQYRKQLAEGLELGTKIEALMAQQQQITQDLVEAMRRETLNHCVRQLQHSLAIKQETLSAAVLQKSIVKDLEQQIALQAVEEEAAKLLVKELSPTEGLIAEGLLGFIRNFTGQMNNIIRKIWSYPLQILECGISSSGGAELDYKFPMMVETLSKTVPDVKQGSTGMQEIVDVAFKVVAMRYLDLAESPLYLDEFTSSFDNAHRNASIQAIKSLMDTEPFTQLFMVSHYQSSYGSFTNAEICVLDARNITVPDVYNRHVTIA